MSALLHLASSFASFQMGGPARVGPIGPAIEIQNLGLTQNLSLRFSSRPVAGRVFVEVDEATQHADLNVDGDLSDRVLHVVDLQGGAPIDLGLASSFQFNTDVTFFTALGHVPFGVDEAHQGSTDLNGDGDALDLVLHLVNLSTLRVTNLGLIAGGAIAVEDGRALLNVLEDLEGRDLNGDGDALDRLVFALDLSTGAQTLLGQGSGIVLLEGQAIVVEQEWIAGTDLNGDGDLLDESFRAQDLVSGASERLKVVSSRNGSWQVVGHTLFSNPRESDLRLDLNGDGDHRDNVLHAFDLLERSSRNLGSAAFPSFRFFGPWILGFLHESTVDRDLNLDGDRFDFIFLTYDESRQSLTPHVPDTAREGSLRASLPENVLNNITSENGVDVNGDGDGLDQVPQLYDLELRRRIRLPYALSLGQDGPRRLALVGEQLSFLVNEPRHGTDLNGDGDRADTVLHVYTTRTGLTESTGLAAGALFALKKDLFNFWPGPGGVLFPVSESDQGGVDLNADGDILDDVLHVLPAVKNNAARRSVANLGLVVRDAFFCPEVRARWIGLPIVESIAGFTSPVPVFHHIPSSRTFSLGAQGEILAMDEEHALVTLAERHLGDLNGDGDALDLVLHRVTLVDH